MLTRLPNRGGNWVNGTNAGLGALNLNNHRGNANSNRGGRLANDEEHKISRLRMAEPRIIRSLYPDLASKIKLKIRLVPIVGNVGSFLRDMAKTTNNLFDEICSFDNIYQAYLSARKSKRQIQEVAHFSAQLEENLLNLHNHLVWDSWKPGKVRTFRVFDPKQRDIEAPPFADRVLHHALVRVVEPLFERRFIAHSYACRVDKGPQRAVWALQKMLRSAQREWGSSYIVKCDISKYFASINHAVLFGEINRTISCKKTLGLWLKITEAYGYESGVGVPVGALTSQLDGNIVLNALDHRLTSDAGYGRYVRYMDDFIVIVKNKSEARDLFKLIEREVSQLGLMLNPKSKYFPSVQGVDFAGYRTWSTHILPRKRNMKKANKRFKSLAKKYHAGEIDREYLRPRVASFLGYTKHCSSKKSVQGILNQLTIKKS